MTDDNSGLSQTEATQWDAIVASEWPAETALVAVGVDLAIAPSSENGATSNQHIVMIFRPRRPRVAPLLAAIIAISAGTWVFLGVLVPKYRSIAARGYSPPERASEIHQLTVAAVLVAVALALALGCLAVWMVAYSRYRLRCSSCTQVTRQLDRAAPYIRPPNPATAAAWILLLLNASGVAGWWIPLQLRKVWAAGADTSETLRLASSGALAWLVICVLCAMALTTWAVRESRHRLRCAASGAALQLPAAPLASCPDASPPRPPIDSVRSGPSTFNSSDGRRRGQA